MRPHAKIKWRITLIALLFDWFLDQSMQFGYLSPFYPTAYWVIFHEILKAKAMPPLAWRNASIAAPGYPAAVHFLATVPLGMPIFRTRHFGSFTAPLPHSNMRLQSKDIVCAN